MYAISNERFKMNNKGYSLVEIILAMGMGIIILGAVALSYIVTSKTFRDVKSISDTIQTKTPSIELISRYLDRWGIGVVSREEVSACRSCVDYPTDCCPPTRNYMTISTTNDCSDITFYGNLHGFGFVRGPDPILDPASIISCRLQNNTAEQNCYILWRDNVPMNDVVDGKPIPLEATGLSDQNKECLTLSAGTMSNATLNSTLQAKEGKPAKIIKAGDSIQRFPHRIRLYCGPNSLDGGRKWLYVKLTDTTSMCGSWDENATAIAPVNNFQVAPLPVGCNSVKGECMAIRVEIAFRSPSQRYAGQFDEYKVTKVYGKWR